ncbi:uncharacterized protein LOC135502221 [Lineus longissimus]|uniref:uncharacterized protein LOC135502221 n=1 Tax=Lineus longissimus TaxID=88925 RepID=UPI00315D156E
MMILPLLVIFLAAAVPGFDGATLRIGVFVSPDTIRDWARIKHGTFATLKSAMEGGLQSEVSDVFSTSQGFPWNVNVRFSSIEQISQSKVDEWINNAEAKPEFRRSAPFARDFCTYVNRVKGTRYDVGILVLRQVNLVSYSSSTGPL